MLGDRLWPKPTTSALQRFRLLLGALPTSHVMASGWAQFADHNSMWSLRLL
jgi:hypothetical protein